ncbi:MAG: L-glutamine synthetase, partial [Bacteroidetes bacterium]|nr:L-glutamine synthetase [Bacteroidota bacterium]
MPTAKVKASGNIEKVFKLIKDRDVKIVDLKFTDLLGQWQHFSVTTTEFSEETFEDGIGFDGSSIRGFRKIHESDMILFPDPDSAFVDPFTAAPTLSLICDVADPITRENYSRDPRNIAKKAEAYLKSTGIGDTAYFGPEPEFFILDNIRFDQSQNSGYYYIDSSEGAWNSGTNGEPNLGHKPRYK